MSKFNNSIAVITGAGSGIGRELALQLIGAGAKISISDINQQGLNETVKLVQNQGGEVHAAKLDVSNRQAVFNYADQVNAHYGQVNLVINNAGVALASGCLADTTIEEFEWLMGINFSGVLYGTKAFLPILEKAEWGHIVNISSLFGLIGVPEQAAYNASKFAVRGMTEALRQELEQADSHISCTSVHPGGIKTNIARNARAGEMLDADAKLLLEGGADRFDKLARTSPMEAAQQILDSVVRNKRRLLIGGDAKLMDRIQRLLPNHYQIILKRAVERMTKD